MDKSVSKLARLNRFLAFFLLLVYFLSFFLPAVKIDGEIYEGYMAALMGFFLSLGSVDESFSDFRFLALGANFSVLFLFMLRSKRSKRIILSVIVSIIAIASAFFWLFIEPEVLDPLIGYWLWSFSILGVVISHGIYLYVWRAQPDNTDQKTGASG